LRKGTHIGLGALALTLKFIPSPFHLVLTAALALASWLLRPYHPLLLPMARPVELRDGVLWGVRYYFGTIFIVSLLFYARPEVTATVWLVLALADGLSATVGGPKSMPVPWNKKKPLAGMIACFIGAFLSFPIAYGWYGIVISPLALFQFAAIAAFVAVFESIDMPLDDNLVIGIVSSALIVAMGLF
jgi:dolichol kinase